MKTITFFLQNTQFIIKLQTFLENLKNSNV